MPRYRLNIAVSLDGFIADTEGGVGWLDPYHESDYSFPEFMAGISLMIQGSTTYEQVLGFGEWPYGAIPNIVLTSRELPPAPGANVAFHKGTAAELVRQLESHEGDIWIVGGPKVLAALLEAGVRPRVELAIIPTLIGEGIPLFTRHQFVSAMKLVSTRTYSNGMVMLIYDPA